MYAAIATLAAEGLPVQLACRLLSVAQSGYQEWLRRPPSARAVRHAWLTEQIQAVHTASLGTYGTRRVHAELTLGLGLQVGHNQVELLMARGGIKGLPGNRRPPAAARDADGHRSGRADVHPGGAKSFVGH